MSNLITIEELELLISAKYNFIKFSKKELQKYEWELKLYRDALKSRIRDKNSKSIKLKGVSK